MRTLLGCSRGHAAPACARGQDIGAEYGIGAYILEAGSLYDLERLFAGVIMLSALGVAVSWLIGLAERRLLAWRT